MATLTNLMQSVALKTDLDQLAATMATKAEFASMRTECRDETKVIVAEAVDPVKDKLADFAARLEV